MGATGASEGHLRIKVLLKSISGSFGRRDTSVALVNVEFFARNEVIVSGMIAEEAVVVRALTIFDAFELDLPRLLFFGVVNAFPSLGEIAGIDVVQDVELESPNDVGCVLDVPRLLEALEGDRLRVVGAVETADDDEGSVGVALKFLELSDGIINAEFGRIATCRDNLQVVKANDGRMSFVGTERFEQGKQFVDGFVLKLQNAQISP